MYIICRVAAESGHIVAKHIAYSHYIYHPPATSLSPHRLYSELNSANIDSSNIDALPHLQPPIPHPISHVLPPQNPSPTINTSSPHPIALSSPSIPQYKNTPPPPSPTPLSTPLCSPVSTSSLTQTPTSASIKQHPRSVLEIPYIHRPRPHVLHSPAQHSSSQSVRA